MGAVRGSMNLSAAHHHILQALLHGATLKTHRYLDGTKICQLHPLDGPPQTIRRAAVDHLKDHGLIESNKKFPAATYLLTPKGQRVAQELQR